MPTEWTIELPYVAPPLSSNQRLHHMAVARLRKQLRADAFRLALAAKLPRHARRLDKARIVLHWQGAVRRPRDNVNINPTLKPLVDGLIDYGLCEDDNSAHVVTDTVIEPVGSKVRLWLTITDLSNMPAPTEVPQ